MDKIKALLNEVFKEVARAQRKHPKMNSPHEGWAIIREELDELWELVRADTARGALAEQEAIQIAAMAIRYCVDLIEVGE